jgi:uncharacterized membrane protein YqgA involved in biofilm formation
MGLLKGLFIFCLALIIGVVIGVHLANEYQIRSVSQIWQSVSSVESQEERTIRQNTTLNMNI